MSPCILYDGTLGVIRIGVLLLEKAECGRARITTIEMAQMKTLQGGGYKQTTNHVKSTINLIILDVKSLAWDMHTLACKMEMDAGVETQSPTISA